MDIDYPIDQIINKGSGAGGANTNKHGLYFEEITDLKTKYTKIARHSIIFNNHDTIFRLPKYKYIRKELETHIDPIINNAYGCIRLDEYYINEAKKQIFIIEKKYQQVNGSVCEKIQTCMFKKWYFNTLLPGHTVIYIYCLSDWYKQKCQTELIYLYQQSVPVFWGQDPNYKSSIIDFMVNYTS